MHALSSTYEQEEQGLSRSLTPVGDDSGQAQSEAQSLQLLTGNNNCSLTGLS